MSSSPAPTASQAYDQAAARIRDLLKRLEKGLQTHAAAAGQRPKDWGFVGDLNSIETRLQEMTQTFQS
jgi:hypothetical protein